MLLALASFLFGAACTGSAGDLFDEVEQEVAASGTSGRTGVAGAGGRTAGGAGRGGSSGGAGARPVGAGGRGGVGVGGASSGTAGSSSVAGNGSGTAGGSPVEPVAGAGPGPQQPTCDPCPCSTGEFGEPELVAGLQVAVSAFGAAPSADGLTLFFSAIDGDEDLFFASRDGRGNQFSPAAPVPGVNEPEVDDGTPFVSTDGSALYFFSTRTGPGAQGGRDLWVAARAEAGAFTAPEVVAGVNTDGLEHLPRLSPDGNTLMFVSSRDSENLGSNIWVSERSAPGEAFGEPVELAGVNTNAREEGFWLSDDGLSVVFASNRAPEEADMDIWLATRPTRTSAFEAAENLSIVNTAGIEIDPAFTRDGFELFFASDRSGTMQLYRSARICPE